MSLRNSYPNFLNTQKQSVFRSSSAWELISLRRLVWVATIDPGGDPGLLFLDLGQKALLLLPQFPDLYDQELDALELLSDLEFHFLDLLCLELRLQGIQDVPTELWGLLGQLEEKRTDL